MGFFAWSAPVFHRVCDRRWTGDDVAAVAARLRPYVPPGGALLDVGGGTGVLAAGLAGALHTQVAILDPTPQMLAYAPDHPALSATVGESPSGCVPSWPPAAFAASAAPYEG